MTKDEALEKKAQNARELGLDYEPVIDQSAAKRIATSLGWEPPRKPLTDEEIDAIEFKALGSGPLASFRDYARRIEAAHGIKEEA